MIIAMEEKLDIKQLKALSKEKRMVLAALVFIIFSGHPLNYLIIR
jgi:hypothetical protein